MTTAEADAAPSPPAFTHSLLFYVNGKRHTVDESTADPGFASRTVLDYLRSPAGGCLTGTKLGCGEGGCGACTVMVSSYDPLTSTVQHRAVNACLAPLCSLDSCSVTTVEGVSTTDPDTGAVSLHPVQQRLAALHFAGLEAALDRRERVGELHRLAIANEFKTIVQML